MNRREWIGAVTALAATLPSGAVLGVDAPVAEIIEHSPMTIGYGGDTYTIDWIRACKRDDWDTWLWEWRSRRNNGGWVRTVCRTKEPKVDVWGGLMTVSVANGLEFIWNG